MEQVGGKDGLHEFLRTLGAPVQRIARWAQAMPAEIKGAERAQHQKERLEEQMRPMMQRTSMRES